MMTTKINNTRTHGASGTMRRTTGTGRTTTKRTRNLFLGLLTLTTTRLPNIVEASNVQCTSDTDCHRKIHQESDCVEGRCTNPYYKGGCLHNMLDREELMQRKVELRQRLILPRGVRICHSEDPDDASELGHCRPHRTYYHGSDNDDNDEDGGGEYNDAPPYAEIRIASQDWESVFFSAWIMQIFLSEVLDVPTTIESGAEDAYLNFYDPQMRMEYGTGNDWNMLRTANDVNDCRAVAVDNQGHDFLQPDDGIGGQAEEEAALDNSTSTTVATFSEVEVPTYRPCAHIVPEFWIGHTAEITELEAEQYVDPPNRLGALGQQSWFIPKITGEQDPSLLSYLGLVGEENRQKLAETFLRPVTWQFYCDEISEDNCLSPNKTATRPPFNKEEGRRYFFPNAYEGYFHLAPENNCTSNSNCTGHLVDYPCGWSSYAHVQAYHLDIAMEAIKFPYGDMLDIVYAANATKSHVIVHWWTPEALYQQFLGTDFELMRVNLPPPTQECIDHRITMTERCSGNLSLSLGDPLGACDETPHILQKVFSQSLYRISKNESLPAGVHSPAYDFLSAFKITHLQLGVIFDYWLEAQQQDFIVSSNGYQPRVAVCRWVVENYDRLQSFIPESFPRVFREKTHVTRISPVAIACFILAIVSTILVIISSAGVFVQRKKLIIRRAQVEFLWILLAGLLLVCMAALILAIPPTNVTCVAAVWLFNIGYTMELAPLIVKVAAINRLMNAAQQYRRVVLKRQTLFGVVFAMCAAVAIYLFVWTIIDPPLRGTDYELTDELTVDGETIVTVSRFCQSKSTSWRFASVAWHVLLLVAATVLAIQTRNLRQDMNETQTLAILIYSHFFFVLLRVATFLLETALGSSTATLIRSLLLSCDISATVTIYFIPKLLSSDDRSSRMDVYNNDIYGRFTWMLPFRNTTVLDHTASTGRGVPQHRQRFQSSRQGSVTSLPDNVVDALAASGAADVDEGNETDHNLVDVYADDDNDVHDSNNDGPTMNNIMDDNDDNIGGSSRKNRYTKSNDKDDDGVMEKEATENLSATLSTTFSVDPIHNDVASTSSSNGNSGNGGTATKAATSLRCRHCGKRN